MINISDLIGQKFVYNGRSKATGYDCYGLAIEVCKRYGHKLPDVYYEEGGIKAVAENYAQWFENVKGTLAITDKREEGNLVVFFSKGRAIHVGVLLNEDDFIHADLGGVRVENLDEYYRKEWKVFTWLK